MEVSSTSGASSASPRRMEYSRWMVVMTTCAAGSMRFEVSSCTLYSSVNLRPVSGVTNVWNSRSVCRPRLPRSTRKQTRCAPAYFSSR